MGKMTAIEAAKELDGCEYTQEGSKELFERMKDAGLVAVFGASDDLIEFRGAIYDEVDAYEGGTAYLDQNGLIQNDCENDECPHFEKLKSKARTIEAKQGDVDDDQYWSYETTIPHTTFKIMEDDGVYCLGIVFNMRSLEL